MPSVLDIVSSMKQNSRNIRYGDLLKVCTYYFGEPRMTGGPHAVFKTPWTGEPRINIQNSSGFAKPYQVIQVLKAISLLEKINGE